jgi:hypothetical protein
MSDASNEPATYVCRINRADIIEFVNDAWVRFAGECGSPTLPHVVIGTSLWRHITGSEAVHLYRQLLAKVRETNAEVSVPFRCDSPTMRRFMRMKITPLPQGQVEFSTWIEREEPYLRSIPLLDPFAPKDQGKLLRMCSWCKKIENDGSWLEIEEAVERLGLFDKLPLPEITHGICDGCLKMMEI